MKHVKAVLAISLAACTSWQVEPGPVPKALVESKPRAVRLSLKSGARVELYEAATSRDNVVGFTRHPSQRNAQRIAVATADVARVEYLKTHALRSAIALGIAVVALVEILYFIAIASALD
jgi:hypothetical protein